MIGSKQKRILEKFVMRLLLTISTNATALDNLLSYCDVDHFENEFVNPVRDYEFTRYNQQGCIKQNQTFMDLVFCEDYIDIPGEGERRFLKTLANKSHLIIPSATLFTDDYNSQILERL